MSSNHIQKLREAMVPALLALQTHNIFSPEEIKSLIEERTTYEYMLQRRQPLKSHYLAYIRLEWTLRDEAERRFKLKKNIRVDRSVRYHFDNRLHHLFSRACDKFQSDVFMWIQWIKFCQLTGADEKLSSTFEKAKYFHPNYAPLYIEMAWWHFRNLRTDDARKTFQHALRSNRKSAHLWLAYLRFELMFIYRFQKKKKSQKKSSGFVIDKGNPLEKTEVLMEIPSPTPSQAKNLMTKPILQGKLVTIVLNELVSVFGKIDPHVQIQESSTQLTSLKSLKSNSLEIFLMAFILLCKFNLPLVEKDFVHSVSKLKNRLSLYFEIFSGWLSVADTIPSNRKKGEQSTFELIQSLSLDNDEFKVKFQDNDSDDESDDSSDDASGDDTGDDSQDDTGDDSQKSQVDQPKQTGKRPSRAKSSKKMNQIPSDEEQTSDEEDSDSDQENNTVTKIPKSTLDFLTEHEILFIDKCMSSINSFDRNDFHTILGFLFLCLNFHPDRFADSHKSKLEKCALDICTSAQKKNIFSQKITLIHCKILQSQKKSWDAVFNDSLQHLGSNMSQLWLFKVENEILNPENEIPQFKSLLYSLVHQPSFSSRATCLNKIFTTVFVRYGLGSLRTLAYGIIDSLPKGDCHLSVLKHLIEIEKACLDTNQEYKIPPAEQLSLFYEIAVERYGKHDPHLWIGYIQVCLHTENKQRIKQLLKRCQIECDEAAKVTQVYNEMERTTC